MMIMLDDEKNNVSEGEQNGKENIKQRKYIFADKMTGRHYSMK